MSRRSRQRIYWREQGDVRRAYGDFRDYRDVGGAQEALREPGQPRATSDPDVAARLLAGRLEELDLARRNQKVAGRRGGVQLAQYAAAHLVTKAMASGSRIGGSRPLSCS